MKKLLIGLSIATLSTISLANERTGFYLKTNVGANKMNEAEEKVANKVVTSKSTVSPSFSVGMGGYINDFIRTDITFDYSKVSFKNATTNFTTNGQEDDNYYTMVGDAFIDRKASVYSMMLNSYIDLPMNDNSKIFIGGGIGLARIKEKIIAKILEGTVYVNNVRHQQIPIMTDSSSTKEDLNFAYSLMLGTSIKVAPNVNIEIAYSWKDFGVTKPRKWQHGDRPDKNRYNGHSVMTGIRFDL
jgi:opacity protein-like surface antigen